MKKIIVIFIVVVFANFRAFAQNELSCTELLKIASSKSISEISETLNYYGFQFESNKEIVAGDAKEYIVTVFSKNVNNTKRADDFQIYRRKGGTIIYFIKFRTVRKQAFMDLKQTCTQNLKKRQDNTEGQCIVTDYISASNTWFFKECVKNGLLNYEVTLITF